ncbi:MAG: ATP-dependent Lon protease [Chloroflexota bacterium]|nr:ATP-dependent Lon protease [Chloroflexota bacterium]
MSEKQLLLPLLALDDRVILPHMAVPVALESQEAWAAVTAARETDGLVLLLPRIEGEYGRMGTVAHLDEAGRLPDGREASALRGMYRGVLNGAAVERAGTLWITVEPAPDPALEELSPRALSLGREYRAIVENLLEVRGTTGLTRMLRGIHHPGQLADLAGYSPDLTLRQQLDVLEEQSVEARLEKLIAWTRDILAEASIKDKIRSEVNEGLEQRQREYYLRQQLEAIKKELGEDEGDTVSEYRQKIAETPFPDDVRKEVERELGRLERTSEQNPEHGWIRNYLDWMVELPWGKRSDDQFDVAEARRILDADHTGLDDVKGRIIEYLAVKKRREGRKLEAVGGRGSGAIITLVGPPGVGKTSLGESVARALGRKFTRVSLGGIHDEAEIRGHRRTYVGAIPGRIARALKEAGTMNPVIMLDEIDKVGNDWRGDPSSALLEVLDPAQNHTFRDHYLEVDLDLSDVLFIPTANVVDTIPGPLLDRMEVVQLDGYTVQEKLAIARDHLVRRQLDRNGLDTDEASFTDEALLTVIEGHTREAGVRGLERQIGKVLRKVATQLEAEEVTPPVTVGTAEVRTHLGRARFQPEAAERTETPGVATGLAVTGTGGDVLFIEASSMAGSQGLTLTGQLGDVMKESVQIALSYIRSHATALGIESSAFADRHFHVHVPAGAIPKDGPSAGITMVTALASLLLERPVRGDIGMTGEVTLQGKVLPIGGVKQKLLAAHRAGLKEVILPQRNEPDLDDVPETVREELKIHLVSDVSDVLRLALEPARAANDGLVAVA